MPPCTKKLRSLFSSKSASSSSRARDASATKTEYAVIGEQHLKDPFASKDPQDLEDLKRQAYEAKRAKEIEQFLIKNGLVSGVPHLCALSCIPWLYVAGLQANNTFLSHSMAADSSPNGYKLLLKQGPCRLLSKFQTSTRSKSLWQSAIKLQRLLIWQIFNYLPSTTEATSNPHQNDKMSRRKLPSFPTVQSGIQPVPEILTDPIMSSTCQPALSAKASKITAVLKSHHPRPRQPERSLHRYQLAATALQDLVATMSLPVYQPWATPTSSETFHYTPKLSLVRSGPERIGFASPLLTVSLCVWREPGQGDLPPPHPLHRDRSLAWRPTPTLSTFRPEGSPLVGNPVYLRRGSGHLGSR